MLTKNGPKNEGEYKKIVKKLLREAMADKFSEKDMRAVYHKFNSRSVEAMKDNTWNNKLYKRLLQDEHYAYKDVKLKKYEEKDAYDTEDVQKYFKKLIEATPVMAIPEKYYLFNVWKEVSLTSLYFCNKKFKGELKELISSNDPFVKRKHLYELISFTGIEIVNGNKTFSGRKMHKLMKMQRHVKLGKIADYFYAGYLLNDSAIIDKIDAARLNDMEDNYVAYLFTKKIEQRYEDIARKNELKKRMYSFLEDYSQHRKNEKLIEKQKEAEDLEKLMDIYDLDEDERELVRSGEYDPEQFDEENPEEGDYYYEEWKEEQEWLGNKVDDDE